MASYFILGLIEIFMLCFNEIKLEGGGLRGWRSGLKGAAQMRWAFCWLLADEALAAPGKPDASSPNKRKIVARSYLKRRSNESRPKLWKSACRN